MVFCLRVFRLPTRVVLTVSLFVNLYLLLSEHYRVSNDQRIFVPNRTPYINRSIFVRQRTIMEYEETHYCQVKSPWSDEAIQYKMSTDMTDWRFVKRVSCPTLQFEELPSKRLQVFLRCEAGKSYMVTRIQNLDDKIEQIPYGEQCLIDVIDNCCYDDGNKVPNVAHFVWYQRKEILFFQHLTLMALLRFMKPCLILIHGPEVPFGRYWDRFISRTPNVIHVIRKRPHTVNAHRLAYKEHASDLMRIEVLQKYGGVYVDADEVLLRSLDPLRKFEYTQGREESDTMGSQLILAKKNATFLRIWHKSYENDYKPAWQYNALRVPWAIAKYRPESIHVEGYNFTRPNGYHRDLIFDKNYDWSTNYAMHFYIRYYEREIDYETIRTLNTTVGSISRHILFGNKELCVK